MGKDGAGQEAWRANLALAVLVAHMALIFYLSSGPPPQAAGFAPDYILHGGEFGILCGLALWAWRTRGATVPKAWLAAFALTVIYGFSDEYHQSFVPGRDASLKDLLWDVIGGLAVGAGTLIWSHLRGAGGEGPAD
jgi:VanZ family protein